MKKIIILFLLSCSLQAKDLLVEVPGMVCQMCVYGMKKHFKSAVKDPDKDIIVDLEKKTVLVKTKEQLSDANIKERVKNAGYEAAKISWIETKKSE